MFSFNLNDEIIEKPGTNGTLVLHISNLLKSYYGPKI